MEHYVLLLEKGWSREMQLITSWDDGYPSDLRLGELLRRYGISGTFFVPRRNSEGKPVLTGPEVRELSALHEIGGHTLDHVYLRGVRSNVAHHQIRTGKAWIEDELGKPISSFCYPGGKYNSEVIRAVRTAGFKWARTTENLCSGLGQNAYKIPTTLQFFPHTGPILVRNLIRYPRSPEKLATLTTILRAKSYWSGLGRLVENWAASGRTMHIWGHSWEIEQLGLWRQLEDLLRLVRDVGALPLTISQACVAQFVRGDRVDRQ